MHKNVERRINGDPKVYFSDLYKRCEAALRSGKSVQFLEDELLGDEILAFDTGLNSIEKTAILIKEERGEGLEAIQARKLVARVRRLLVCADDLLCAARQGEAKMANLHARRELMFQYEEL
ncbi:hypothetical protein VKT23_019107 [Stygiomarasmius scandens]|uniref:Uncharacterized protein n=1 Tax=Marasmiellus scandens TaxID=2682957 RepID=A0ABR1IMJ2_9AGAR